MFEASTENKFKGKQPLNCGLSVMLLASKIKTKDGSIEANIHQSVVFDCCVILFLRLNGSTGWYRGRWSESEYQDPRLPSKHWKVLKNGWVYHSNVDYCGDMAVSVQLPQCLQFLLHGIDTVLSNSWWLWSWGSALQHLQWLAVLLIFSMRQGCCFSFLFWAWFSID